MIRLDIDLSFTEVSSGNDTEPFSGKVTAEGREVVVTVSDATRLPGGGRRALAGFRVLADGLADRGISLRIDGPAGTIVAFGNVKSSVLQRVVTGSTRIRLGRLRALAPLISRRNRDTTSALAPPPATLLPLAPTLNRRVRRRVTTTHYTPGSGRPRLIFAVGSDAWDGRPPREFDLLPDRTRIGSGPDADLRLDGLEPLHAEIRHEDDDEYVLYPLAATGGGYAVEPGRSAQGRRILRTGARIEMGKWRLAYFRAEWADHGRPFGGRQGGELAIQLPQPPPSYPRRTT